MGGRRRGEKAAREWEINVTTNVRWFVERNSCELQGTLNTNQTELLGT